MSAASLVVSIFAFLTALYVAITNRNVRRRQESAAMTNELYPVLRSARDAAFNFGKPLGGGQSDQIVNFHNAIKDLIDLRPSVQDATLRDLIDRILQHDAAGFAAMIDPERFIGMTLADSIYINFTDCSRDCINAIQRCRELRKGIG